MRKGRGWLCPCLAEWAGGIPAWLALLGLPTLGTPLAALRILPHPSTGTGGYPGAVGTALGRQGVPSPTLAVLAECSPPGFRWVLLVYEPAGCCGGLTSGRLTKGPHKSLREDGMAGHGWVNSGCPEAAAATASSLKWGYCVFWSVGPAVGFPVKPSGNADDAGRRDQNHSMALPGPLLAASPALISELGEKFRFAERYVLHRL